MADRRQEGDLGQTAGDDGIEPVRAGMAEDMRVGNAHFLGAREHAALGVADIGRDLHRPDLAVRDRHDVREGAAYVDPDQHVPCVLCPLTQGRGPRTEARSDQAGATAAG